MPFSTVLLISSFEEFEIVRTITLWRPIMQEAYKKSTVWTEKERKKRN